MNVTLCDNVLYYLCHEQMSGMGCLSIDHGLVSVDEAIRS
jgi:hypothetical protein